MNKKDKISLLNLLKQHIIYKDGFYIIDGEPKGADDVRQYIRNQYTNMLERDITDCLDELSFNKGEFDIESHFVDKIKSRAKKGSSFYFSSLDKIYPGNKFRQIMNYYLFSSEHYCFILEGYGQTGKSTFVNVISKIVGEEYFGRSSASQLKTTHGTTMLEGMKLFEVSESQDLDHGTANNLKDIITQDMIFINPKHQHQRMVKPHAKLIMSCNSMPVFRTTDDGIIRRFIPMIMNTKLPQQPGFMELIEIDIGCIIYEALNSPFKYKDFSNEVYSIFINDAQFGFECGPKSMRKSGGYHSYQDYCKDYGFYNRNKTNYDRFIELEKIYRGQSAWGELDTTSKDSLEVNGTTYSPTLNQGELPF